MVTEKIWLLWQMVTEEIWLLWQMVTEEIWLLWQMVTEEIWLVRDFGYFLNVPSLDCHRSIENLSTKPRDTRQWTAFPLTSEPGALGFTSQSPLRTLTRSRWKFRRLRNALCQQAGPIHRGPKQTAPRACVTSLSALSSCFPGPRALTVINMGGGSGGGSGEGGCASEDICGLWGWGDRKENT